VADALLPPTNANLTSSKLAPMAQLAVKMVSAEAHASHTMVAHSANHFNALTDTVVSTSENALVKLLATTISHSDALTVLALLTS
jgi:hypothetical protein